MDAGPRVSGSRVWGLHPLYPNRYVWFVFLSALDVYMTYLVLWFGGREANSVANWVLQRWGISGLTLFKFALVIVVIGICEIVGRRKWAAGRLLIHVALFVTCIPVVVAFGLLLWQSWFSGTTHPPMPAP
jgi:hypothetical protein